MKLHWPVALVFCTRRKTNYFDCAAFHSDSPWVNQSAAALLLFHFQFNRKCRICASKAERETRKHARGWHWSRMNRWTHSWCDFREKPPVNVWPHRDGPPRNWLEYEERGKKKEKRSLSEPRQTKVFDDEEQSWHLLPWNLQLMSERESDQCRRPNRCRWRENETLTNRIVASPTCNYYRRELFSPCCHPE